MICVVKRRAAGGRQDDPSACREPHPHRHGAAVDLRRLPGLHASVRAAVPGGHLQGLRSQHESAAGLEAGGQAPDNIQQEVQVSLL